MKKRSFKSPIALISFASIGILIACGPYYAPRILEYRSTVIEIPTTDIELMFPNNKKPSDAQRHLRNLPKRQQATLEADLADLKMAMPQIDAKLLELYSKIRKEMIITDPWGNQEEQDNAPEWLDEKLLNGLPKEFALYHQGAVQYKSGLSESARENWQKLLKLPAADRKYRSIWAAWMLARSSSAKGEGTRWYQKVLELKKAGFPDSLGVTENDWTNYFAYRSRDYLTAISGYIKDGKEGKIDSIEAASSVQTVFYYALSREENNETVLYKQFASNKEHAIAFSYYLKNRLSPWEYTVEDEFEKEKKIMAQWIEQLILSEREDKDKELGISATAAYALHDEESLQLCLSRIKIPTIDSMWLEAKHATFSGDLAEASKSYSELTEAIKSEGASIENAGVKYWGSYRVTGETVNERLFWLYSEYASVELGLKNYGKALDLFVLAHNDSDAAYIAETLMTPTELLHHVRTSEVAKNSKWLQELLSRKLMRNEYFKDAKPFILEQHIKTYDKYTALYRFGNDKNNSNKKRSEALEKAAYLQDRAGSPLFSLENGARPFGRIHAAGRKVHENYDYSDDSEKEIVYTPKISADELARIKKNYIRISPIRVTTMEAAELLYRAAVLLPRNDDHAAKLLWTAGNWTRSDPQIADKYYQALVKRCWNTKLGKACDERRWFLHDISGF